MIAIIDYGMGNVNSVLKAFRYLGAKTFITDNPKDLDESQKIVLPGVGAFPDAIKNLEERGFLEALKKNVIKEKKPFLGICLGMQLTAVIGFESEKTKGFGWFENSSVQKFKDILPLKIPHVGWNDIFVRDEENLLFKNISTGSDFYFVHSYHYNCDEKYILATCDYGYKFPIAIAKENIYAVQFHPEKSQKVGLLLLENFKNL